MKGKKILGFMVSLLLVVMMAGCGEAKDDDKKENMDTQQSDHDVADTEIIDHVDSAGEGTATDIEPQEDDSVDKDQGDKDEEDKDEEGKDKEDEDKEDRTLAPNFTLDDGKGNEYSISDYKNKLLLVNFFTTWCTYCVAEMPDFQKIYDKYRLDDVAILGVNVQKDPKEMPKEDVLNWIADKKITFPIVFDDEGEAIKHYYLNGYPTTYVIDKEGYIVGYVNALDEKMLEKIIEMYR